jgi:glycosyltransferase involved in cell wall biosynthesis
LTKRSDADVVYFLMFDGWASELRSNRWHYATRWARRLPVVLVQPSLLSDHAASVSRPEARIANCRILQVRSATLPFATMSCSLVQTRQILADMTANGFRRPILWTYSPDYLLANALIPAAARVYHATENYFYFDNLNPGFMDRLRALLAIVDLVVAVSEGVAASYRPNASGRIEVVTNGCDFGHYARGGADPELTGARAGYTKTAVYAGNINGRLDLDLIARCASACGDTLFAMFGPVAGLSKSEAMQWQDLLRNRNVRYFGTVDADRLPSIFATADVGLIPYRQTPFLVDNGFPLKTFEMQAAGLPVISTYMKPLEPHAGPGLRIAATAEEFVPMLRTTTRAGLSERARAAMSAASRAQDYDGKVERVAAVLDEILASSGEARAPGAELFGFFGQPKEWLSTLEGELRKLTGSRPRTMATFRAELAARLTRHRSVAARLIPQPMRRRLRRLLSP